MEKLYSDAMTRSLMDDIASLTDTEMESQGFTKEELADPYGEKITNKAERKNFLKRISQIDYSNVVDAVYEAAERIRDQLKLEGEGHPLLGITCMECGVGKYIPMHSSNLRCNKCGVIQRGYIPIPAMVPFHQDRTRIKFAYGGFGVGKTTSAINEDIEMALEMPGLKTLIGTADLKQLSSVALLEFLRWCPETLIARHNKTLNELYLTNGSMFYFRPLYDEEKIKSLTLGRAHVIESSAIKKTQQRKIFKQLQKRLRQKLYKIYKDDFSNDLKLIMQKQAMSTNVIYEKGKYKVDLRQIVYESNPVDDFFLDTAMTAKVIHVPDDKPHHDYESMRPELEKRNRFISTWTFPTWVNAKNLPEGILEEWKSTMTDEEYLIEVEGSLKTKKHGSAFKGLKFIKPFAIPPHWKRIFATDSGIVDSRTWFALAIDPIKKKAIVYGMVGESDWTINAHARMLIDHKNQLPANCMFKPIQADKQLFNTRDNDKGDGFTSNSVTYERLGLKLHKAESQTQLIEQGVAHINNLIHEEMLEIMEPYDDYALNQGMVVQKKMKVEVNKYARGDDGKLPVRKGADGPDSLRYVTGPVPSNKESLGLSINGSFTQDITTGRIITYKEEEKQKRIFNGSLVFGNARADAVNNIDEDFAQYSPFKI